MKFVYEVVYQPTMENRGVMASGKVETVEVTAASETAVRAMFTDGGFRVIGVTEVRAVVDWAKPNYSHEEAAVFLGLEANTLSRKKDLVPCCAFGKGLYPREWLEKMLADLGNERARELISTTDEHR